MTIKKITPEQRKKIYAVAREIGLDNDLLHTMVLELTRKEHINDLSLTQAARVIDQLGRKSAGRTIKMSTGRTVLMATDKQLYKIKDLAKQLGWDDPKRLRGFCQKYAGIDNPDWMTKEQAWRIIEGLKSVLKQQKETPGGTIAGRGDQ